MTVTVTVTVDRDVTVGHGSVPATAPGAVTVTVSESDPAPVSGHASESAQVFDKGQPESSLSDGPSKKLTCCTRVRKLNFSRSSMKGGFQFGGGTILQIPKGLTVSLIDSMYFAGSENSLLVGWKTGASVKF